MAGMVAIAVLAASPAGLLGQSEGPWLLVVNKSESTLSFMDPETVGTAATVGTGHTPHEVAVSPDGRWAYVTDYGTGPAPGSTVTVVDVPGREAVRTIGLGPPKRPHGITAAADGSVWVTTEGSAHWGVIGSITAGVEPDGMAWEGRSR